MPAADGKTYPDEAINKIFVFGISALLLSVDEQMPFKIREFGDFTTVRMLAPGVAMLLTDGNEKAVETGQWC